MREERLYFAYGSNINLDQMEYRCPAAKHLMPVMLHGYELTFRGGGVATVVPNKDSVVPGLLWSLTPDCERSLDRYEGYPNYYHKADVALTDPETGKIYYAMMYEMDERYREPVEPSPFYFGGILEGYRQNGMDERPLLAALKKTRDAAWELESSRHIQLSGFEAYPAPRRGARAKKPKNKER